MKITILFFGILILVSCNKYNSPPLSYLTADTLTYHIYNSKGREIIFIKTFDHPINSADSTKFLDESIAKSLKEKD